MGWNDVFVLFLQSGGQLSSNWEPVCPRVPEVEEPVRSMVRALTAPIQEAGIISDFTA